MPYLERKGCQFSQWRVLCVVRHAWRPFDRDPNWSGKLIFDGYASNGPQTISKCQRASTGKTRNSVFVKLTQRFCQVPKCATIRVVAAIQGGQPKSINFYNMPDAGGSYEES